MVERVTIQSLDDTVGRMERTNRQSLYKSSLWKRGRVTFLKRNPLCRYCLNVGITTPATVVDHIVPHRGDVALFYDRDNWQPLCERCHNSVKQKIEKNGFDSTIGPDGFPVDPNHPFFSR